MRLTKVDAWWTWALQINKNKHSILELSTNPQRLIKDSLLLRQIARLIVQMVHCYAIRVTDREYANFGIWNILKRDWERESTNLPIFFAAGSSPSEVSILTILSIITQIYMYSMTLMMSKRDYLNSYDEVFSLQGGGRIACRELAFELIRSKDCTFQHQQ
mgnify:CR=1 FL=1